MRTDPARPRHADALLGVGYVVVLALFVTVSIAAYAKVLPWQRTAHVEVVTTHAGLELNRYADVKLQGRIVGEVRGPEVVPMCNAMSQGNDGSMATIHASDSAGAFMKLANYAAQGPERLSLEATNLMVASAVDLVVLLAKSRDGVRVVSVHPGRTDTQMQQELVASENRPYDPQEFLRPSSVATAVRTALTATPDATYETISIRPAPAATNRRGS